ncbi:AmmeMemoRadiSam system radical SAM enzyme [Acidobacteria bacterium AH-259-L09]|nr:AmmeMemoRadiSam system radical SAM enzyme [Acidobacteria bacterium AH-259-L09]
MAASYEEILDTHVTDGELYRTLPDGRIQCYACGHECKIRDGRRGICQVRYHKDGKLRVPTGYVGALQCDPTEKKPFFHVFPGSKTLTFGMLGCDYHCGYCQNWITSQALRDKAARAPLQEVTASELAVMAERYGACVVGSSYNEPLITAEWAIEVFRAAKHRGLRTAFISNGNATREALEYLRPCTDCYKVDLKSMRDLNYRRLGGRLSVVLDTIRRLYTMGFWVEIVTLIVPGFNDSREELRDAAEFLVSVSADIPWHVTAFHPDYKMTDRPGTASAKLMEAVKIGQDAGLRFTYAGNLPGGVGDFENTRCPQCEELLVERHGFRVRTNRIAGTGVCPRCKCGIPGIWS